VLVITSASSKTAPISPLSQIIRDRVLLPHSLFVVSIQKAGQFAAVRCTPHYYTRVRDHLLYIPPQRCTLFKFQVSSEIRGAAATLASPIAHRPDPPWNRFAVCTKFRAPTAATGNYGSRSLLHRQPKTAVLQSRFLWSPYGIGQTIIFSCCDLFFLLLLLLFLFLFLFLLLLFLSPNLSRLSLDVCHTSTHGVALVRI